MKFLRFHNPESVPYKALRKGARFLTVREAGDPKVGTARTHYCENSDTFLHFRETTARLRPEDIHLPAGFVLLQDDDMLQEGDLVVSISEDTGREEDKPSKWHKHADRGVSPTVDYALETMNQSQRPSVAGFVRPMLFVPNVCPGEGHRFVNYGEAIQEGDLYYVTGGPYAGRLLPVSTTIGRPNRHYGNRIRAISTFFLKHPPEVHPDHKEGVPSWKKHVCLHAPGAFLQITEAVLKQAEAASPLRSLIVKGDPATTPFYPAPSCASLPPPLLARENKAIRAEWTKDYEKRKEAEAEVRQLSTKLVAAEAAVMELEAEVERLKSALEASEDAHKGAQLTLETCQLHYLGFGVHAPGSFDAFVFTSDKDALGRAIYSAR